ncbi:MAG: formate--tetrahydrofolate ligase [Myxococcota bacterium]|nr:formate--tetrahydrofolate ligase [Myxococcota bacterium]
MLTDTEIAQSLPTTPLQDVANVLGIHPDDLIMFGRDKAKVSLNAFNRARHTTKPGKLILVSAITPTKAGEGKTTTTIGLGQALGRLGKRASIALREPSLGPCMGVKGGATGGGFSQIRPAEDINLHFTGDFHAITAAHNLLSAAIDNSLHRGNPHQLDPDKLVWRRVIDMNDRGLRDIAIGLGAANGVVRQTGFDITASSEVMAIVSLADTLQDLRVRINRIIVGLTYDGQPVTAEQFNVTGAMIALLKDALVPNLVQTLEGTPAFVHTGPFANIAHGCNSVIATRLALHYSDWVVTEAGFGFDLGAEKFIDIKCRIGGFNPDAVVIVATVRALKMHGGVRYSELSNPNTEAVRAGLPNLARHLETCATFNKPVVVAINRFGTDSPDELSAVEDFCVQHSVRYAIAEHFAHGGEGAISLAKEVCDAAESATTPLQTLYSLNSTVQAKIEAVAQKAYGASGVILSRDARRDLKTVESLALSALPICIAKTQNSVSDNPRLKGRPTDFQITVQRIIPSAGAGFLVVLTGDILRMPGLPKDPQAAHIDVVDGTIVGLR